MITKRLAAEEVRVFKWEFEAARHEQLQMH